MNKCNQQQKHLKKQKHKEIKTRRNENNKKWKILTALLKTKREFFKHEVKKFYFLKCKKNFQNLQVISWKIRKEVENYKFGKYINFWRHTQNWKKSKKFGDIEIKNQKFHQHKETFSIKKFDINKMAISNRVSFDKKRFKYFIRYKDAKKFEPYVHSSQKWLYIEKSLMKLHLCFLLIKDDELLEKYNEIWEKVKDSLKKELDNESVYNKNI